MRALPWLVASAVVASTLGYYPYGGCADCGRPSFCPPCPAPPACSALPSVAESSDCGQPACSGGASSGPPVSGSYLGPSGTSDPRMEGRLSQQVTQRLPVTNEVATHRKYPQARVLEIDATPTHPGSEEIEEEVSSEAPFVERTPPTPPPVMEPSADTSGEIQSLPPYLQRVLGARSRVPRKAPTFKCNDERLRMIMHQSMDPSDLAASKRSIANEAEQTFQSKFDVICSPTRLSYLANTRRYCEVTQTDIVCLAFAH
uniref:Ground-like domain-containing protein n=1 Tax=Steinernema glaseri TaxID=37863 RepID=A0A1I7YXC2_9BILA